MGRRLFSAAAADRLLRRQSSTAGATSSSDLPDLAEEDVWATATDTTTTSGGKSRWLQVDCADHRRHVGGLSMAFDGDDAGAMSAPVAVTSTEWTRTGLGRVGSGEPRGWSAGEEEVEDEGEWVPPHEYLAREQGKAALATSVFEGVGRTLKGRDLSRVRNAVWSQTGFSG